MATDHDGRPEARVVSADVEARLDRLTEEGIIGRPRSVTRPTAAGRPRPEVRRSLADVVSEQRR